MINTSSNQNADDSESETLSQQEVSKILEPSSSDSEEEERERPPIPNRAEARKGKTNSHLLFRAKIETAVKVVGEDKEDCSQ